MSSLKLNQKLKLRHFPAPSHTRLGDLIRKDRSAGGLTETEQAELLKLLRAATKTSEANATILRNLRGNAPTKRQQQSNPPLVSRGA
jgi:hypothetical protein